MSQEGFTSSEWKKIYGVLEESPERYDFPVRRPGSILLGSFNIRKLGAMENRSEETWDFLAKVCSQFDLLAVQEVLDDLSGLKHLLEKLGPEFGLVVSDKTGVFPGTRGVGERLAFIFRWRKVERADVVSDISYDRSVVLDILHDNLDEINQAFSDYGEKLEEYESGKRKTKPNVKMPVFLSFIRQPYLVGFRIPSHIEDKPYEFMAVDAHLFYGDYTRDRRLEFNALLEWIIARVKEGSRAYYPNFILLGDLNLDFDDPEVDIQRIEKYMKSFDNRAGERVNVNFPFLDVHPGREGVYRTNARLSETFDQIGLFFREEGLPTYLDNQHMGEDPRGPDYGVFNFVELFSNALLEKSFDELSRSEERKFLRRFQHEVSDHMPLWLRLKGCGGMTRYSIKEIEGIGDVHAKTLAERGIKTTGALLMRCRTPRDRKNLADEAGISDGLVLKWANLADLMRISGIGEKWGDLLEEVGVDTVPELAQRDPDNLHKVMEDYTSRSKLARRKPGRDQVVGWIERAKRLDRMLQY